MSLRSKREKDSVDNFEIYQNSYKLHQSFAHVFECSNTLRYEKLLKDQISLSVPGKKVLDIGCGLGNSSLELLKYQPEHVLGIDISTKFINYAKRYEQADKLHFMLQDIALPIEGKFDVIFGRSILHHLDYQEVLARLYCKNLNPGGVMLFMEPLGPNLLLRLYWRIAKNVHTLDEKPFIRQDLTWIKNNFEHFDLIPINYFSFLFGILSSKIFKSSDNWLMKICDIIDVNLAKIDYLKPNYRQGIFIIKKEQHQSNFQN